MTHAALLGPDGQALPSRPARGGVGRAQAAGFHGASVTDPDIAGWLPTNYSAHSAWMPDRSALTARIHDLARNDGWASGGITRQVDSIIGSDFRLASKPRTRSLGITPDQAAELAADIETAFADWAEDPDAWCDAGRRLSWSGIVGLSFRHRLMDGEACATIPWLPRGGQFATTVKVIDPDRLSNPYNAIDTWFRRSGVELGPNDDPIGYHVRLSHPGDQNVFNPNFWKWEYIPRETPWGRRMFVHAFEPDRAGQYRGVSSISSIVKRLRMLNRYDEAELQAAVLNAVMAAVVESPFDQEQLANALSGGEELSSYQRERSDYYRDAPLSLGGAKVAFVYPGEKVNLTKPAHPNAVFEHFTRASLRNVASALGMTYEQLSMDWGQVNYSSARAALIEVWRGYTTRRGHFAAQFCQPIYAAWLEEAIEIGKVKLPPGAPDFHDAKAAYCNAKWIGPGRGWVDPQKEANASVERMASRLSTLEAESAEQGQDWIENLDQIARERKEMRARGIDPDSLVSKTIKQPPGLGEDADANEDVPAEEGPKK